MESLMIDPIDLIETLNDQQQTARIARAGRTLTTLRAGHGHADDYENLVDALTDIALAMGPDEVIKAATAGTLTARVMIGPTGRRVVTV
jgi:hypothetical protein